MKLPDVPPTTPRERELLAELRELRNARTAGVPGFIYCLAEKYGDDRWPSRTDAYVSRAVKVGWARDPDERIKGLQTGNPRVLKILGTIPALRSEEPVVHAELQSDNVLQEWFRPTPKVLAKFGLAIEVQGTGFFTVGEDS